MYPVRFFTGTYQEYKELQNKSENSLYFCTDKQLIFRDGDLIPVPYTTIENGELPADPIINLLYLDDANNLIYVADEELKWHKIFGNQILARKTFKDALRRVSYDPATRIITIPQIDNDNKEAEDVSTLTIDLGEDLIVDQEHTYYDAEARKIIISFRSMDTTDTDDITSVEIPVDDLIDVYQGSTTDSIIITVDAVTNTGDVDTRTIAANIKIKNGVAGNDKPNYLKLDTDGLYVDGETYTDNRLGNLSYTPINNTDVTTHTIVQDVISDINTDTKNLHDRVNTAQSTADSKVPLTRVITATGIDLSEDRELKYSDIIGSAPITSPTFDGEARSHTQLPTSDWDKDNTEDIGSLIATLQYVRDAIQYSTTWGVLKQTRTWGQLKNGGGK